MMVVWDFARTAAITVLSIFILRPNNQSRLRYAQFDHPIYIFYSVTFHFKICSLLDFIFFPSSDFI